MRSIAVVFLLVFGYTSNARSQWIQAIPLIYTSVTCFAANGSNLYAGTFENPTLWVSNNDGITWKPKGVQVFYPISLIASGTFLYAGADTSIYRSNDDGLTWTRVNSSFPDTPTNLTANGRDLFAVTRATTFYSKDSGISWTPLKITNGLKGTAISNLLANGQNLFASTDSGFFRSTDKGTHWTSLLLSNFFAADIAVSGNNIFVVTDSGILRSLDNGVNWNNVGSHGNHLAANGTILIGGTEGSGVFLSKDSGTSWINLGIVYHRLISLTISGPNAVAGTISGGIWYQSLQTHSNVNAEIPTLNTIELSPNPTTGIITVHKALANMHHVTISSSLGENVLELLHPNAPEFILDLSKLPPGTYFARFSLPNEVVTRKILKQ
ncbi:MAG: T9SS type A sorting domain-containing protein [Candidatus Kapaibacterium sp.]